MDFENRALIEEYYEQYKRDPASLDPSWRVFFEKREPLPEVGFEPVASEVERFRQFGHKEAQMYPQGMKEISPCPELPEGSLELRKIYCGSIGYEFSHCPSQIQKALYEKIESQGGEASYSTDKKRHILHLLNKAESFETFLHTKYVGQKRFSLEGAETLIPMVASLLDTDINELIIGMPHRGRLNVLSNILNKTYKEIFSEFEDVAPDTFETSGDVKYHKGYASKVDGKSIYLVANPSHLESVDSVVEGIARARQTHDRLHVLPLLIHGDAAIAGQGVVYETLQLGKLEAYATGGTIHVVINNHIGFTTLPEDSRSTDYCTDIAKAFGCPIFHVNAEDPEACLFAMELAFWLRQQFAIDVFIDLNCWRKYGHNESDEPAFTQPLLYQVIRQKPTIRTLYHDQLVHEGVQIEAEDREFKEELAAIHAEVKAHAEKVKLDLPAKSLKSHRELFLPIDTGVPLDRLREVAETLNTIPDGFSLHPRLKSQIQSRQEALQKGFAEFFVDWSFAESLAFGTLLADGVPIRLAGQDSRRGTFSQRHGMWVDQKTALRYYPHRAISQEFELIDSLLSEYAALGFEYGYSLGNREAFVLWEAQFGDFANGAQIIIDQYLSTGEQKWGVHSRLALLLPHGYEGQGPEHSSGRMERFLTLCAEDNMIVVNPSTPAQYFHLLRRQAKLSKPLIIFTPKGLLRLPACQSKMQELAHGHFQEVIDDTKPAGDIKQLIFCQGRIFYDIQPQLDAMTAIIRIEQLYPLHLARLEEIIAKYTNAERFFWVQEEPYNMGAYHAIQEPLQALLPRNGQLEYRGRQASASPACGSHLIHEQEHELIIESLLQGHKK